LEELTEKIIDLGWNKHRLLRENGKKDEKIRKLEREVEELRFELGASVEVMAVLREWERSR
jgi:hypothetical protein